MAAGIEQRKRERDFKGELDEWIDGCRADLNEIESMMGAMRDVTPHVVLGIDALGAGDHIDDVYEAVCGAYSLTAAIVDIGKTDGISMVALVPGGGSCGEWLVITLQPGGLSEASVQRIHAAIGQIDSDFYCDGVEFNNAKNLSEFVALVGPG